MSFDGIPTAALDFYEDLEADNSKAFWTAHKSLYEEAVRAPIQALAEVLAKEFGAPKFFRPYRDVRFSKDKTPYKTHQGVWFTESSTYLHVSAAGLYVAAGYWDTSSAQVDRLRRGIADDVAGPALDRAIKSVQRTGFELGGHQLTRVPSGYDKEHPRAELLRYKSLTVHKDFGCPGWLATKRAQSEVTKAWRAIAPLTDWLDTHVGRD
ncbi:MAG TPA: DUF2461 domain-containing protein [Jatrophihabitantaceae bacterium]|nr:DUF2461 domain-containing protein [Jatrophihabitantaceae bacterium]